MHRAAGHTGHLARCSMPAGSGKPAKLKLLCGGEALLPRPGARLCWPAAASCGTCTVPPRPRSGPAIHRVTRRRGPRCHRPAHRQHPALCAGRPWQPGAGRRGGRAVHRRGRPGARLSARPELTAERFVPDPFCGALAPACTAPATWPAGAATATWSTWAGSTTRSRCAASASSWARSKRCSRLIPACAQCAVVAASRCRRRTGSWSPMWRVPGDGHRARGRRAASGTCAGRACRTTCCASGFVALDEAPADAQRQDRPQGACRPPPSTLAVERQFVRPAQRDRSRCWRRSGPEVLKVERVGQ